MTENTLDIQIAQFFNDGGLNTFPEYARSQIYEDLKAITEVDTGVYTWIPLRLKEKGVMLSKIFCRSRKTQKEHLMYIPNVIAGLSEFWAIR
jgi:hypothetical protein